MYVTKGSEKQIAWANQIVAGWLVKLDLEIGNTTARVAEGDALISGYLGTLQAARAKLIGAAAGWSAGDVINRKGNDIGQHMIDQSRAAH